MDRIKELSRKHIGGKSWRPLNADRKNPRVHQILGPLIFKNHVDPEIIELISLLIEREREELSRRRLDQQTCEPIDPRCGVTGG